MKKLLAMVLALVMTLSLAVSANAAFKDDKDISADYAEAAAVLDGMGVFEGIDGSFLPKDIITRAQVAAIIYRVATADTAGYGKDKSGLYATYNKFSDMLGAGWASGYIGYCANAEYVKGYPDGTFKPSGNVTGYEVLTMILRAVGYDKNGEFSGSDWSINVAKYAEQLGILKNVDKATDLSAPATRELVAELLFRTVAEVPMVTYTAAFGYQNVAFDSKADNKLFSKNPTLGAKNFALIEAEGEDDWGRPTKVWAEDSNDNGKYDSTKDSVYAEITCKADATYSVATAQCDIVKALGTKKLTDAKLIVNGDDLGKFSLADVTTKVGAQGRQIEVFYKYNDAGDSRIVMIDTFLARVEETADAKYDKNGHQTSPYTITLTVFDKDNDGTELVLEDTDAAFDYEEDDFVLVNSYTKDNTATVSGDIVTAKADKYAEIVSKAETMTGAQTRIWYQGNKHTVADKDYDDAYKFILNNATNKGTATYTWFLDQFGNLIGVDTIDSSSYAVLKDIRWIDGKPGVAKATLVYMDGTTSDVESVEVSAIDGFDYDWDFDEDWTNLPVEKTEIGDLVYGDYAGVSASSQYNEVYEGIALFRVDTQKDGDVKLKGYDIIDHVVGTTLNTDASSFVGEDNAKVSINNNTQFLVRTENEKGEYVYNNYSRSNLPQFEDESVEAYYYIGTDGYAKYVYVKNAELAADFGDHVFVPKTGYSLIVDENKDTYELSVVIDGKERTIQTNGAIAAYLSANAGKLFHVEWGKLVDNGRVPYGFVKSAVLVNEYEDCDNNTSVANNAAHEDYVCDYITYSSKNQIKAGTIVSDSTEYNWQLTDKTVYIGVDGKEFTTLTTSDIQDHDIWVIGTLTRGSYEYASVVYVGEKLDKSVALDVTAKDGSVVYNAVNKTFAFTSKKDATSDELTFTANDANSVIVYADEAKLESAKENYTTAQTEPLTVTVWNEAATESQEYTVTFDWDTKATGNMIVSGNVDGNNFIIKDLKYAVNNLQNAFNNANELVLTGTKDVTLTVSEVSEGATVRVGSFVNTTTIDTDKAIQMKADLETGTTITVKNATQQTGGVIVVEVTSESGVANYYVWKLSAN